ncbi:hypothetical protein F5884DRAFT_853403 [Xylogone sp. PMI_703]|nr:hypothetical protein F5884DRAFT_853403 [Xylogone sp. PMI_703]
MEAIYFEPTFGLLICRVHGSGVHPTREAIRRHLRGEGHLCRGQELRHAISTLIQLPLNSLETLLDIHSTVDVRHLITPIPNLKVLSGWSCVPCSGRFLTTSLEVVQRHAASQHGRRRGDPTLWEDCKLQTFFSETKDRRYFRVRSLPNAALAATTSPSTEKLSERHSRRDGYTLHEQLQRRKITKSLSSKSASPIFRPLNKRSGSVAASRPFLTSCSPSSNPARPITFQHPLTRLARKYVSLPECRIDDLFKSDAFRLASEPLFDSSHVDAALNVHAVFPEVDDSPVFLHAILYSTIQLINHGAPTIEGLALQSKTIELLKKKLTTPLQTLCSAAVGAVMILKATAYKTCDLAAYKTHTQGLADVLKFFTKNGNNLTPAAKRAMFWLDLSAAVLVDSERQMSHVDLPLEIEWQRERCLELAHALPVGFVRYQKILPVALLECISDTVQFQACLRTGDTTQHPHNARNNYLELMQASIESRLVDHAPDCRQLGGFVEAIRLGIFICCYCSWIEPWSDKLVPSKLANNLLDLLEATALFSPHQPDSIWLQYMDILLWLLLISSSVVDLDQGRDEGLRSRQSRLVNTICSASDFLSGACMIDLKYTLQTTLQDFVYVDGWLQQRHNIREWLVLELCINAANN